MQVHTGPRVFVRSLKKFWFLSITKPARKYMENKGVIELRSSKQERMARDSHHLLLSKDWLPSLILKSDYSAHDATALNKALICTSATLECFPQLPALPFPPQQMKEGVFVGLHRWHDCCLQKCLCHPWFPGTCPRLFYQVSLRISQRKCSCCIQLHTSLAPTRVARLRHGAKFFHDLEILTSTTKVWKIRIPSFSSPQQTQAEQLSMGTWAVHLFPHSSVHPRCFVKVTNVGSPPCQTHGDEIQIPYLVISKMERAGERPQNQQSANI